MADSPQHFRLTSNSIGRLGSYRRLARVLSENRRN